MKRIVAWGLGVLSVITIRSAFAADGYDGVILDPFLEGGNQWTFLPSSFELLSDAGDLDSESFSVETFDGPPLTQCLIEIPWVPVSHANGVGNLFPDLELYWTGSMEWRNLNHLSLTAFDVDVRDLDGNITTHRFVVGTEHMDLEPTFFFNDEWAFFHGILRTSVEDMQPLLLSFPATNRTEIRVRVCALWVSSEMHLKGFVLRTIPIGG